VSSGSRGHRFGLRWLVLVFSKNVLARDVGVLVGATVVSQGMAILAAPVLSRIYAPGDFAVWAAFSGLLGVMIPFATGRYEQGIPLADRDDDAALLLFVCLACLAGSCLVCVLGVALFRNMVATWIGIPQLSAYLWLLPMTMFVVGGRTALIRANIRRKKFRLLAIAKGSRTAVVVAFQVVLGLLWLAPGGLLLGDVAGKSLETGILVPRSLLRRSGAAPRPTWRQIWATASEHWRYPVFLIPAAVINAASIHLNAVLFPAFFGKDAAGQAAMALLIVVIPGVLLARPLSDVLHREFAVKRARGVDLLRYVLKMYSVLFGMCIVPALVGFWLGPTLVPLILGEEWVQCGRLVRYLMPWVLIFLVAQSSHVVLILYGKQNVLLLLNVALFVMRLCAVFIGFYVFGNIEAAVQLWSLVSCVGNLAFALAILHLLRKERAKESAEEWD
jgi:O-antigen/teichoic acid export membrane protein